MTPEDVAAVLQQLADIKLLVGIPSDSEKNEREDGTITNATLGYIHETGSPARGIPARPFLLPGVEGSQNEWVPYLEQAAAAAFEGDAAVMEKAFEAAGQAAVSAVKATITAGIPPPIKPATMAARARYRGSRPSTQLAQGMKQFSATEQRTRGRKRADYRGYYERYEAGIETKASSGEVTPLIDTASMLNSITYVVKTGG